ncbi:unnamed protein product [Ixodes hexagonus]
MCVGQRLTKKTVRFNSQQHGPDSIHSWLTAAACALSAFFALAPLRSSGILYVIIMSEFNVSRQDASWTIMLLGGARVLSGLLAGPLGHRFTARPVILLGSVISALGVMLGFFADSIGTLHAALGVIHGFGSGIVYAMNPIVISEHFVKYKGLAMGINFAGSTLGTFVFPKLLEYLVQTFGFHGALLIFGALLLNSAAFSLFLRQPIWLKSDSTTSLNKLTDEIECQRPADPYTISGPLVDRDANLKAKPESMLSGLSIFKVSMFYVITYSFISFNLSYDCYNSLFIDFAIDKGIPMSKAVTMTSLSSVPDLVGRLVLPAITDRGIVKRRTFMMTLLALVGILYIVLPYQRGYATIFVLTSAVALLLGCGVVLFPVLLVEYVGLDRMAMATGMLTALSAVFSFGKPSIIGYFRDTLGSYHFLFVACGCVAISASLTWVVIAAVSRNTDKNKWTLQHAFTGKDISPGKFSYLPSLIMLDDGHFVDYKRVARHSAASIFY